MMDDWNLASWIEGYAVLVAAGVLGFALLVVVICWIAARIERKSRKPTERVYRSKGILTNNEREFHQRLCKALPRGWSVWPQVSMGAILEPVATNGAQYMADFRRISQQRADWVVADEKFKIRCVIELDDRMHDKEKDKIRDERLKDAGITCLRFESRAKPSVAKLASVLAKY